MQGNVPDADAPTIWPQALNVLRQVLYGIIQPNLLTSMYIACTMHQISHNRAGQQGLPSKSAYSSGRPSSSSGGFSSLSYSPSWM